MKTLRLLMCICALSACFKVSEGQRNQWNIHQKRKNVYHGNVLVYRPPFHSEFRPAKTQLTLKHLFIHQHNPQRLSHFQWEIYRGPKYYWVLKCPVKNNTTVTTQTPFINSNKSASSSGVTPAQNFTILSARESTVTTYSSATLSPQQSQTSQEDTAAPPTSYPMIQTPQPSSASLETIVSPNTKLDLSAATLASEMTSEPTIKTSTPATTQTAAVEQTTLSPIQNELFQFLQYLNKVAKYISDFLNRS